MIVGSCAVLRLPCAYQKNGDIFDSKREWNDLIFLLLANTPVTSHMPEK